MHHFYNFEKYDYISFYQNRLASAIVRALVDNTYDTLSFPFDDRDNLSDSPMINQALFEELIDVIKNELRVNDYLLWDVSHTTHRPIHSLDRVSELVGVNLYRGVILVFDNNELARNTANKLMEIESQYEVSLLGSDNKTIFFGSKSDLDKVLSLLNPFNIQGSIEQETNRYLFNELIEEMSKPNRVHSSNVYANRYINARSIFCNNKVFNIMIYRMALLLKGINDSSEYDFDAFICASENGACIASALSVLMKKPVIFLRNVGPHMAVNDDKMVERIISGKRYVFIYDFICMGTEYQRIKMLCNIRHARIHSSIGISHYKLPEVADAEVEVNIHSLFDINSFGECYKCFVLEEDCEKYIDQRKNKGDL